MSEPGFHDPQRHTSRRRSPALARRGPSLWRTRVMAAAFVAALATFQRVQGGVEAMSAPASSFAEGEGVAVRDALSARFALCRSGGDRNCVVDGDTFRFAGDKYRLADLDTPETHRARCAGEAALGEAATERLRTWLNAGAFTLERAGRDTDRYGRNLRIVTRGGTSVGSVLIDEGLARPWDGARRPWC